MRVLVNAASANMGGARTYLRNVTAWMVRLAPGTRFIVVAPEAAATELRGLEADNLEVIPYPYEGTGGWKRVRFDQMGIRTIARSHEADLLYSTTGFGTWFSPVPQALLVRNMAYFDPLFHEQYRLLGRGLWRNSMRRWLSILSMRRSDAIFFPTEGMRTTVGQWIRLAGRETAAIHYGFDRSAVSGASREPSAAASDEAPDWAERIALLKRRGDRILLNVSTFSVQKNLETLIRALPDIVSHGGNVTLVTTTSREQTTDVMEYDSLKRLSRDLGVEEYWLELGTVPYERLGSLYELADVFVFPSFTESFGHPMVEAMSHGLPVVAADTVVNREVCGVAGLYFEPFEPMELKERIVSLLVDDQRRNELSRTAEERSAVFSWEAHARHVLDHFERLSQSDSSA